MWIEKLFAGVLRVLTPLGPRYIRPSLAQRIYLLWVFRHFQVLPLQVLTRRQRRVIDALCVEPRFVSLTEPRWMGSSRSSAPWSAVRPIASLAARRQDTAISDAVSPFASADLSKARRAPSLVNDTAWSARSNPSGLKSFETAGMLGVYAHGVGAAAIRCVIFVNVFAVS